MLKKGLCLLLAIVMLFSLTGCTDMLGGAFLALLVITGDDRADKDDIFQFVCEHEEQLRQAIEDGDFSTFENQGFIKEIDVNKSDVDFACGGYGMGPETAYVGFFYTPDNDMAAVWCAPYSVDFLVPCGDGFEWWEAGGDNHYYTERICENFYYYEADF